MKILASRILASAPVRFSAKLSVFVLTFVLLSHTLVARNADSVSLLLLNQLDLPLYFKSGDDYLPIQKRPLFDQRIPQDSIEKGKLNLYRREVSEDGVESFQVFLTTSVESDLPSRILLFRDFSPPYAYQFLVVRTDMESIPTEHALILNYTPRKVAVHAGGVAEVVQPIETALFEYDEQRFAAKFQFASLVDEKWDKPELRSVNVLPGMRLLVIVTLEQQYTGQVVFNPFFIRLKSIPAIQGEEGATQ